MPTTLSGLARLKVELSVDNVRRLAKLVAVVESWQLEQLVRLARLHPEKVQEALSALWQIRPDLLQDLAISAVDHGDLSLDQCASILCKSVQEIVHDLATYRVATGLCEKAIVRDAGRGNVAKLVEAQVPVWEVIRIYQRNGSLDEVRATMPALTESELLTALRYAERNPEEIDEQIRRYESMKDRRKNEYPFFG